MRALLVSMLVSGFVGCARRDTGEAATVRDSAGVRIVESRAPVWRRDGGWHVAATALLEIGAPGTPTAHDFERVDGLRRLADGRVVVADGGASTITMFGADGGVVWAAGRSGDGPGEYRLIQSLGVGPGDSVWVYDFGLRRFTILTLDGHVARTVPVRAPLSALVAVGRLSDGRFVMREMWSGVPAGGEQRSGLRRDSAAIVVLALDGSRADTVTLVLGREVFIRSEGGRAVMSAPLIAHAASAALWGDRVIDGDQERFTLSVVDVDGRLARSFRIAGLDLEIGATERERLLNDELDRHPAAERATVRRDLEGLGVPATKPAYGDLLVGAEGDIWVAEYAREPAFPAAWTVLDSTGAWLGTVAMPAAFRPFQIGPAWVLGVYRDEMDLERIRLYRLSGR